MVKGTLPTVVSTSKYDRIYGPYKYDPNHEREPSRSLANRRHTQHSFIKKKPDFQTAKMQYHSKRAEHSCKDCDFEVGYNIIKFKPLRCKVLIPNRRCYSIVREMLHENHSSKQDKKSKLVRDQGKSLDDNSHLKSWIFTPSHGRSLIGNLNFVHNMVQGEKFVSYIHVLVVQRSQFEEYARRWGSSHVIIKLPESMPGVNIKAEIGKVGYARRFIQLLAENLGLETIFMVDDNIPYLYDIKTTLVGGKTSKLVVEGNQVQRENVSLYTVLNHIESQFHSQGIAPHSDFIPHPEAIEKHKLEGYTGPNKLYGVIGVLNHSQYSSIVKSPFKNTHVGGITFINIRALQEQGIKFEPWPAWEDLTLNNDCDRFGLYVLKYNRFVFMKRNIPSWLPDVYVWDKNTYLDHNECLRGKPADRSVDILLNYIQSWAPPKYCHVLPEGTSECVQDMKCLRKTLQRSISHNMHGHHIIFFYPKHDSDLTTIANGIRQTADFDKLTRHVMVFPTDACVRRQLTSVRKFKTNIVDRSFVGEDGISPPLFEVITSHNIHHFNVQMVLVYVEGKG